MSKLSSDELCAADAKIGIVHLVCGKTNMGENFYAYVNFKPSRYEDFFRQAQYKMDLTSYGEILESGFGTAPSPEVIRKMEIQYGIDHFAAQKAAHTPNRSGKSKYDSLR